MNKIAILGGGGTGITMAADLTLRGRSVCLYDRADAFEHLQEVIDAGGVEMTGRAVAGFAKIDTVSANLADTVKGAELVLIAMMAPRHEELAAELAPLLEDGQTVCFSAGNCGSIVLRRILAGRRQVVVGEMQGNVYPCRLVGKAVVKCAFPYMPKKVAAFPAKDTTRLIKNLAEVYECVPAKNVLETTLNSPNVTIHLAGSLLNTCSIDRNPDFCLYRDGLSPGVLACMRQVEAEKALVMEKMGYENAAHCGMIEQLIEYEKHPHLADFRQVAGPDSMTHRYISEDAHVGQPLIISLARRLGLRLTCMEALEALVSVINGVDYMAAGRTIEYLGMGGMSPDEINLWLEQGSD